MDSEQLSEVMKQVEEKGLSWDDVEAKIKVSHDILKLYVQSGPVPVTIMNSLKKLVEEEA